MMATAIGSSCPSRLQIVLRAKTRPLVRLDACNDVLM